MANKYVELKSYIKYCWFIFKWFLIGKYHCKFVQYNNKKIIKKLYKAIFYIVHKTVWLVILLSLIYTYVFLFVY